jgi:hypothetical protein
MKVQLFRPRNAPLVQLETNEGVRFFLVDTGCPISFALHASEVSAGAWFEGDPLPLRRPPFDLSPLSERLGVPIEGFIGLQSLAAQGAAYFDFDQGALYLGAEARVKASEHLGDQPVTCSLERVMSTPLGVRLTLDPHAAQPQEVVCFLDTGSTFIVTPGFEPPARTAHSSLYPLGLVTPMGFMQVSVSAGHSVEVGGLLTEGLNVATGAPPMMPPVLGMEWLCSHHALFDFEAQQLLITLRAQPSPLPVWTRISEDLWGLPCELTFDPNELSADVRHVMVLPRAGEALPEGIFPLTPYRIKGVDFPQGPEGVNTLLEALLVRRKEKDSPLNNITLISPEGDEICVMRCPLFERAL